MSDYIFKIFRAPEWDSFNKDGIFKGSADDARDGFIHLCAGGQLAGTLSKHFSGAENLIIARFDADNISALKWETSRGGEKFPHVYAPLPLSALDTSMPLSHKGGVFTLPTKFIRPS